MKWIVWIFGLLLGGALGLLGSSVDILVWIHMGRPDVLIHAGGQDIHIGMVTILGAAAGLVLVAILGAWGSLAGFGRNIVFIAPGIFLVAVPIYTLGTFLAIKVMNVYPSLCAYVAVFAAALAVARFGAGLQPEQRQTLDDIAIDVIRDKTATFYYPWEGSNKAR